MQSGSGARRLTAVLLAAVLLAGCAVAPRAPASGEGAQLALAAVGLLGTPYRFGGEDPASGLDCSGLVRHAARTALGVELPRQTEAMSRVGVEVAETQLQPGDLVFFNTLGRPYSHVGVYVDGGRFVHAPTQRGFVRIDLLTQTYWQARFDGARRLVSAGDAPRAVSDAHAGGGQSFSASAAARIAP